jgi:hypothetical protein
VTPRSLGALPYHAPRLGGFVPSTGTTERPTSRAVLDAMATAFLPNDFKIWPLPGTGSNQGHRGTCTAFASSACLEALVNRNLSEQHVYNLGIQERQRLGLDTSKDGLSPELAFFGMNSTGVVDEDVWPYVEAFDAGNVSGGPVPNAVTTATKYRASTVVQIVVPSERTFDAICRRLFVTKTPILASTPVQAEAGWSAGPVIEDTTGVRPAAPSHCVALCGFSLPTSSLIFRNSWSAGWGVFGFGIMRRGYFEKFVSEMWTVQV